MLAANCTGNPSTHELLRGVRDYTDVSTGQLTILQVQCMAEKVNSYGKEKNPLSAVDYKNSYHHQLMFSGRNFWMRWKLKML